MTDSDYGFDTALFPNDTPDQFNCPICTLVARKPKECPTCGFIFCSKCVDSWQSKRKECVNRCDIIKNPIRAISGALLRIYNNLDVKCNFPNCQKKIVKLGDYDGHVKICNMPKCLCFDICQNNVKPEFENKQVCEVSCLLLDQIRKSSDNGNNWGEARKKIQEFLKDYAPVQGGGNGFDYPKGIPMMPGGNNQNGVTTFRWDKQHMGQGIEVKDNNMTVFLKESAYMFRTIIGDTGFMSGVHYWEILADEKTENELKIGVSTKRDFNYNSAFCDYEYGFAYYGLGQLRHNSNAAGQQYGKRFKKEGYLGCFLDMNKGTLSFSVNGEFQGVAFTAESLKKGPIYPAVSLLHCAGCKLANNKPSPNIFIK